ncbi:hypothetical protein IWQ60_000835 [Tieghemiomyces parasiticus]|uniref:NADP-dependent oxidoreductase domain-containing protein n=1 Tax=Tieghemiomyces parasiticus TaxID=78921 RepID=A0A9W8DX58_9FUNG|nr:hypothetical protein IWQ60_000835 [Tieghemiomyces parasiticus]
MTSGSLPPIASGPASSTPAFTLSNGDRVPQVGLGTHLIKDPGEIDVAIKAAVRCGYRMIDTATVYRNEESIGTTLQDILARPETYHVTRADLFIVSKLAPRDQGYDACDRAVRASLARLQLDYIDLYLIHWPGTQKLPSDSDRNPINRLGSWRALEALKATGLVRHIGVSNYTMDHLRDLLSAAVVAPSVLQIEYHPLYQPTALLLDLCQAHGIQLQAYSSLGQGRFLEGGSVPLPLLTALADRYQVPASAILLRWGIQHGAVVIPKSRDPQRIRDNIRCLDFELDIEASYP